MTINAKKQSQFELFPEANDPTELKQKPRLVFKELTLSLENIVVCCIVLVMTLVLFFAFGVERGKRISKVPKNAVESQKIASDAPKVGQKINDAQISKNGIISQSSEGQENIAEQVIKIPAELQETEPPVREEIIEIPVDGDLLGPTYTIQVASFKLKRNAQKEASNLKDVGHETFVMSKGSYSIVCVGKFQQKTDAKEFSSRLKNRYRDCLVRRL